MATWKKIATSGSLISQFNNDSLYIPRSGTMASGYVGFWNTATTLSGESSLFWNAATNRLGVNTSTPNSTLDVNGNVTITGSAIILDHSEDAFSTESPEGLYTFLSRDYIGAGTELNDYKAGYFKTTITNIDPSAAQILRNMSSIDADLALITSDAGTITASLAAVYSTNTPQIGVGAKADVFANFYATPTTNNGIITNYYDLYLAGIEPTSIGTTANRYGIYQADGTLKNFFSGSIGVGTNNPTSSIHIVETLPTITLGAKSQVTAAGTVLGSIDFQDAYTAGIRPQATIDVVRGGAGGAGVFPTDLVFYNNNIGAGTGLKEAFRLKYDGAARISGSLEITSISQATTDTDKFLTSDGGIIKYVSGSQLLTYIGGQAALTNPVTGTGTTGYVTYWNGTNTITGESNLFWDASNDRLGIKQGTPAYNLDVTGDARITTNLIVGGDLTVGGTTTVINTANLLVEDKFILLASGSVSATDGGIIVQQAAGGGGVALFYDGTDARWAVSSSVPHDAATVTPAAYMGIVNNVAATTNVVAAYTKPGNINIDSSGDIWIYA